MFEEELVFIFSFIFFFLFASLFRFVERFVVPTEEDRCCGRNKRHAKKRREKINILSKKETVSGVKTLTRRFTPKYLSFSKVLSNEFN